MINKKKPVLFILLFSGSILLIFLLMQPLEIRFGGKLIALLFPSGEIAIKERDLLFIIQALMLLVVIPVYVLTFVFSWKYRAHNTQSKYDPNFDDNRLAEYIWWGLPCLLILVIGGLTWVKTYHLDPYKPLVSDKKPLTVQVVALQWKWLFIYPEEKIATVNFLQIPEKTPIQFEITADAPMNSFWIPKLGGQIYAMPKMRTKLHLIADHVGDFRGSSANLSGDGFAKMHFVVKASSEKDFQAWIQKAKATKNLLDWKEYEQLVKPNDAYFPVTYYNLKEDHLFDSILLKYMEPKSKRFSEIDGS